MFRPLDHRIISSAIDDSFQAFDQLEFIDPETLLATEGCHVVSVYNAKSGKSLRSWSFPELKLLSCPVVYDRTRRCLVAVLSYKEVRMFNLDQEYEEGERHRFSRKISCILPNLSGEPVVCFEDGHMNLLGEAIHHKSDKHSSRSQGLNTPKAEDIVRVQLIPGKQSMDLVIVSKNQTQKLTYNRLQMTKMTQMVSMAQYFELQETYDCIDIDPSSGSLIGITKNGKVFVVKDTIEKMVYEFDQKLKDVRSIVVFPETEGNVIGVVHESSENDGLVLNLVDIRYGIKEEHSLPLPPLPKGLKFPAIDNRMLMIASSRGICLQNYSISQVSLVSLLSKTETDEMETSFVEESDKINQLVSQLNKSRSSKKMISLVTELHCLTGNQVPEAVVCTVISYLLDVDSGLKDVNSRQLLQLILTNVKFNPSLLTNELRNLSNSPSRSASNILSMCLCLLDDVMEMDDKSIPAADLIVVLLDSHLKKLLMADPQEVSRSLINLRNKTEQLQCYHSVSCQLKPMIEMVIAKIDTPSKKRKREHDVKKIDLSEKKKTLADYCLDSIEI